MLSDFKNSVKKPLVAAAITAAAILPWSFNAHADQNQCSPLLENKGLELTAPISAKKASYDNRSDGLVAFSIFPGGDLLENPRELVKLYENNASSADCYLDSMIRPELKSIVKVYVAGNAIKDKEGNDRFTFDELRSDKQYVLMTALTESHLAKTVFASLASNQDLAYHAN